MDAPRPRVMFILRDAPAADLPRTVGEMEVNEVARGRTAPAYDLTLALHAEPDAVAGTVEYAAELFDAASVAGMTARLDALLAAALDAPDVPLSTLPLADPPRPGEERRVAVET